MRIGDRVFVHGYIDEIRKDTVIIRNNGGYFGTIPSEVITGELPSSEKAQLSGEDATSVCKCPCGYREPCDYCHYDAYRGHGCPAEEGMKDE